jgi:hypothetical protein
MISAPTRGDGGIASRKTIDRKAQLQFLAVGHCECLFVLD